jgi:hypothetical protein
LNGKFRSSSSFKMIRPTAPVAPTTAIDSYIRGQGEEVRGKKSRVPSIGQG